MHRRITSQNGVHGKMFPLFLLVLFGMALTPLSASGDAPYEEADACTFVEHLQFDGTLANASVQWQVDLGPRIPGSDVSATFRSSIDENLTALGYEVSQQTHERYDMNLTNVFARWTPNGTSSGQLVLSAHYDSRNIADQDSNETNRSLPVPGANDAASGVAVLLELARHIPSMNLNYDVVLFFNDAEDQDQRYTLGAEAWAENLTSEEIDSTHAFVLLDMVGDADLQLHNVLPGNETLKSRVVELATSLGMVNGTSGCDGTTGRDVVQYDTLVGVLDDHVHAHELGIPSIDLMDTSYGEPKPYTFGSLWHTMEDTPDKVSAESLQAVGQLVELGLRTNAFVDVGSNESETNPPEPSDAEPSSNDDVETTGSVRLASMAAVGLFAIIGLIITVEWKGKP
ncbi:MAG: M28 family peptidase [Poseidonia sp.]